MSAELVGAGRYPDRRYKEPWYWCSSEAGVHPREATADDVLGYLDDRMQVFGVGRVLLASELYGHPEGDEGDWNDPLELGTPLYSDGGDEQADVRAVAEVANLSLLEAAVTECVMDGTPMGYGYAGRIAQRLGIAETQVQYAWRRAKDKLASEWAASE